MYGDKDFDDHFNIISGKLKALQPSSQELEAAKYGKVPRSVGIANNVSY